MRKMANMVEIQAALTDSVADLAGAEFQEFRRVFNEELVSCGREPFPEDMDDSEVKAFYHLCVCCSLVVSDHFSAIPEFVQEMLT